MLNNKHTHLNLSLTQTCGDDWSHSEAASGTLSLWLSPAATSLCGSDAILVFFNDFSSILTHFFGNGKILFTVFKLYN